ncbi:MAG: DUF971 domain-containing protein [Mangrovicoccus sp.]
MLEEITTTPDGRCLRLIWCEGPETQLPADELRRNARDATSIRELAENGVIAIADDLRITALTEVGSYGVNVHFSDGHDRAIYPFSYLRTLSDEFGK